MENSFLLLYLNNLGSLFICMPEKLLLTYILFKKKYTNWVWQHYTYLLSFHVVFWDVIQVRLELSTVCSS